MDEAYKEAMNEAAELDALAAKHPSIAAGLKERAQRIRDGAPAPTPAPTGDGLGVGNQPTPAPYFDRALGRWVDPGPQTVATESPQVQPGERAVFAEAKGGTARVNGLAILPSHAKKNEKNMQAVAAWMMRGRR